MLTSMYIKIRVIAGSKTEEVVKENDDHFVMSVKQKAERNMANRRVLEIVRSLHPGKKVRIVSGHQSPGKIVAVD